MDNSFFNKFDKTEFLSHFKDNDIKKAIDSYYSYIDTIEEKEEKEHLKQEFMLELERHAYDDSIGSADKIHCFKELLKNNPNNEKYLFDVANCFEEIGQYDLRLEILQELEKKTQEKPKFYKLISECYQKLGDTTKALNWYMKISQYTRLGENDYLNIASLYLRKYKRSGLIADLIEAQEYLISAEKINKLNPKTLHALIQLCEYKNKEHRAFRYWKRLIKAYPTSENLGDYAMFCLKNNRVNEGIKYIEHRKKQEYPILKNKKEWSGQKTDKTLLIIGEGIIEDIVFSRYIHDVKNLAKKIFLYTNGELTQIFNDSFAKIEIYTKKEDINYINFEEYVYIADIPRKLAITDFNRNGAYLFLDSNSLNKYKTENDIIPGVFKLGFLDYQNDNNYDKLKLILLSNILELPLQSYSLKPMVSDETLEKAAMEAVFSEVLSVDRDLVELEREKYHIINLGKNIYGLYDMAYALKSLDCVLTTNDEIKCLAAALGTSVLGIDKYKTANWSCSSGTFSNIRSIAMGNGRTWIKTDEDVENILNESITEEQQKAYVLYKIEREKEILEVSPYNTIIMHNIAKLSTSKYVKDYTQARDYVEQALEIKPEKDYFITLYEVLKKQYGETEELDNVIEEILDKYDDDNCYMMQAIRLMNKGDFKNGLKYYKYRKNASFNLYKPKYDGTQDISDSTLLIIWEQGLGDNIMCSRYITEIQKRAKKVILVCREELFNLFKANFSGIEMYSVSQNTKEEAERIIKELEFDYYIAIMDLLSVFDFDGTNYINTDKYLNADVTKIEEFKNKYLNKATYNIGVAYRGVASHLEHRNMEISDLEPLTQIKGVTLYSLQYKEPGYVFANSKIKNVGLYFEDVTDTAAAIENMDLIVTTDNLVAHLAGALGKKTFTLLHNEAEWRWPKKDGANSGWYDSMNVYINQTEDNNWTETVSRVKKEIEKIAIDERLEKINGEIEFYKNQTKRNTSPVINNKLGLLYCELYTITYSPRDINTAIEYLTDASRLDSSNEQYTKDLQMAYILDQTYIAK